MRLRVGCGAPAVAARAARECTRREGDGQATAWCISSASVGGGDGAPAATLKMRVGRGAPVGVEAAARECTRDEGDGQAAAWCISSAPSPPPTDALLMHHAAA